MSLRCLPRSFGSARYDSLVLVLSAFFSYRFRAADPLENTPLLHRMIRGVKRIQGDTKSKPKFPVTLALLERIHSIVDWSDPDQCMMFAAWSLASGGLLRIGEFTTAKGNPAPLLLNRNLSSVRIDGGFVFRVLHLDASKADPFRKGVDIVLGHSTSPANALVAFSAYDRARAASPSSPALPFSLSAMARLSQESCACQFLRQRWIPSRWTRLALAACPFVAAVLSHSEMLVCLTIFCKSSVAGQATRTKCI